MADLVVSTSLPPPSTAKYERIVCRLRSLDGMAFRPLHGYELENRMAEIEKGQQLAGHFPDSEALDRARRILTGQITGDEAFAELDAIYGIS